MPFLYTKHAKRPPVAGFLYPQLINYCGSDAYPFHMPGHKRRLGSFQDPFSFDITEIDGFDNLHHAEGILLEAEKRAARLYGAEETHFLVNGSTAGILSAIGAVTNYGGSILMARNSHKAAYHAVYTGGLNVKYLLPRGEAARPVPEQKVSTIFAAEVSGSGVFLPASATENGGRIRPQDVKAALEEDALLHPDGGRVQAVYITSPTYDGVISDVRAIAGIVHEYGIPLIVDEAHGAHFGMSEIFPESSVKLGADLVIHSVHKTLPSLTQTALIHVQGSLVDRRRLKEMLDIYQTSSPSYVLMASIDNCIRILSQQGKELFEKYSQMLRGFYDSVRDLRRVHLIRTDDPSKILVVPGEGMSARELYDILREKYGLQPEMLSRSYVLMLSSVGDDQEGFDRLSAALHEIDAGSGSRVEPRSGQPAEAEKTGESGQSRKSDAPGSRMTLPESSCTIMEAQDAEQEKVSFGEAAGRVSGEYLYLYPPGIPLITPGEVITKKLIEEVGELKSEGYSVEGADDFTLSRIWVLKKQEKRRLST